jgi:hypothetical protein
MLCRQRGRDWRGRRIVRAVHCASRGAPALRSRRASARFGGRRVGDQGWSPARPVSRIRRSGRCSPVTDSGRPRVERGAPNRYEWPCPGDLLHMDVCTYARFRRPGHRATGDRSQRDRHWMAASTRVGYDYAHAIIDDHSRLAYVELHDDEKALWASTMVAAVISGSPWNAFQRRGLDLVRAPDPLKPPQCQAQAHER